MLINEITRVNVGKNVSFSRYQHVSQAEIDSGTTRLLGRLGQSYVYVRKDPADASIIATMNPPTGQKNEPPIAVVALTKAQKPKIASVSKKSTWSVESLSLGPKFQGFNYAPKLYAFILHKMNIILSADEMQSAGGAATWNRLASEPGVYVWAQVPGHPEVELEPGESGELVPVGTEVDDLYVDKKDVNTRSGVPSPDIIKSARAKIFAVAR